MVMWSELRGVDVVVAVRVAVGDVVVDAIGLNVGADVAGLCQLLDEDNEKTGCVTVGDAVVVAAGLAGCVAVVADGVAAGPAGCVWTCRCYCCWTRWLRGGWTRC